MNSKYQLSILALLSLSQISFAQDKKQESKKKPNVLFVMSDQHRRQAMGFMHEDPVITPNFDRFSEEAVTFTRAYAAHPVSGPNRGCLFSGKYTQHNKVFGNDCRLEDDGKSMGVLFRNNGYSTGYIGKWHLDGHEGGKYAYVPRERRLGFDYWLISQGHRHFDGQYYGDKDSLIITGRWMPEYETDKAIEFLRNRNDERDGNKPFCLVLSYAPPHNGMGPGFEDKYNIGHWNASLKDLPIRKGGGFAAPPRFETMYMPAEQLPRRKNVQKVDNKESFFMLPGYFGAITSIDENFGRLIQELKDQGEWENTIVVYTSDHGELLGSHGRVYKDLWYEESIGVPLMIAYPAHLHPQKTEQPINSIDLLPTLLELADIKVPQEMDGISYAPFISGHKMALPDKIFFQFDRGVLNDKGPDRYYRAVRTTRYTYVAAMLPYYDQFVGKHKQVLYDNEKDPYQLNPIFPGGKHDKIMNKLRAAVMDWCDRIQDPFFNKYWE